MPVQPYAPPTRSELRKDRRRTAVARIADNQLSSMGGTLADTIGHDSRQRLVWLALLAMPLLFPVALPGMGSAVGVFCLVIAFGLCAGRSVPLPAWLGERTLNDRVRELLTRMLARVIHLIARLGRPRWLGLSHHSARWFNGLMLSVAGVSMVVPVPVISFDNVLPALAMVLTAWGLRLRDGLMLMVGHVATLVAAASVVLLWWGGSRLVADLLTRVGVPVLQ
jgi:hypothetical protein